MENIKGQGTQASAVDSLSVPITMLELSKFREAELMAQEYVRTHAEDGMGYLVLYAAKVRSPILHKYKKGMPLNIDTEDSTFPLYVEHRELLEDFFRYGENTVVRQTLFYMKEYLAQATIDTEGENAADLFQILTNALYPYNQKEYSEWCFTLGKVLLHLCAYEEAKDFFENAKATGKDAVECLLHILFCASEVEDEDEFCNGNGDIFSTDMPEYINLLLAIGDDKTALDRVLSLVEERERSCERHEQERIDLERENRFKKYDKKKNTPLRVLGIVLFWIASAISLFSFVFLYNDGAIWDIFCYLTPFGREDATGQIRVSLVTSTVVLCIEQLAFILTVCVVADGERLAYTVRKYVFWFVTHTAASYGVWYVMYGYAHWFKNWLGFFNVIFTLILAITVSAILCGVFVGVGMNVPFFDTRTSSVAGGLWVRGYNREYLALLFLAFGGFLLLNNDITLPSILMMLVFLPFGLHFFAVSVKNRAIALFKLRFEYDLIDTTDKNAMVSTEWTTGTVYIPLALILAYAFSAWGFKFSAYITFCGALLVCGLIHLFFGLIANGMSSERTRRSGYNGYLNDDDDYE